MNRTYVALDLEFTGLDPARDKIIQIGMVRFQGNEVLETFSSLVNPGRGVPLKIEHLIGISISDIDQAPTLRSLMGQILRFVRSYPLVGHTISMDLQFLRHADVYLNNLAIDTFELATIVVPEARRFSLSNLAEHLGISTRGAHEALADAYTSKDLFLALIERIDRWDPSIVREIATLTRRTDWPYREIFQNTHNAQREREPGAVWAKGEHLGPRSIHLRQEAELPALDPTETISEIDPEELVEMISPGGVFSQSFPGYEHRPQQVDMLRAISEAFNIPSHLLVEAGTGTGKSLAYLLPSIYYAVRNGRRVVISSNTINLQDQLYNKDIPDLQRILPISFSAAMLKGRTNYLCLRRLDTVRRSGQLTPEEASTVVKILHWASTTETGDRSELLILNADIDTWLRVQASSETCMGDRCPYFQQRKCFYYRARARAERAHLVVINHALLLSDIAIENRVLPDYTHLIIDEAHHLEEQATNQFGINVSRRDMYGVLASLGSTGGGDSPSGVLSRVPALFQSEAVSSSAREAISSRIETLRSNIDRAERRLYELFNVLTSFLEQNTDFGANAKGSYDTTISLTPGMRTQPDWSEVEIAWDNYAGPMRVILSELEKLGDQVEKLTLAESTTRDEILQEIQAHHMRASEMWTGMDRILMTPDDDGIYWISVSRQNQEITLHSAPLHVGDMLQETLFENNECVVLTSATLRTGNSYDYIKSRLSIEDTLEVALDSPFDYKSAVLLYVPKDIPEPNQPYYQKTTSQALIDLCIATQGRALILFTSFSQLRATYRAIQRPLEDEGIVIYGQGVDGTRRQILENFVQTPRSVLLGTRSFWEGVDVVGEALSCLVITRLPFAVPTDPIIAARAKTFEDPFNQYYLPDSILRLRQGFGRLIRSQEDFGMVAILDKRILTKSYGKTMLRSLPPCTARMGPLQSLPKLAERWLDPENHERVASG